MPRRAWIALLLLLACAAGAYALARPTTPGGAANRTRKSSAGSLVAGARTPTTGTAWRSPAAAPAVDAEKLRYLAIGGGSVPESTEVSLEQNLALLQQLLPGPGLLMFGGGPQAASVRVLDDRPASDPLRVRLGDLFQPRAGRHSRYRPSTLDALAASVVEVEAQLVRALSGGSKPLLLFFATHGDQGEQARDNAVVLWGGGTLSVARLAELHAAHPRPLRVVSASCFSGGFAELAFEHGDPERGPARAPRCGLFAGTWDRETSGCDPDPDRRKQEGYSLHWLQALRGLDRDGKALPASEVDFDADGHISLLEAHARATIAARSIDVPTTTSQRYLRAVQTRAEAADPGLLPEERAVVTGLGGRLGLVNARQARERLRAVSEQLAALDARLTQTEQREQALYGELAARLLGRWPALDDAYHPDFARALAGERAAIAAALDAWPEARGHAAAESELAALEAQYQALEVEEALLTRWERAHETQALAAALRRRGGPAWQRYRELLACERWVMAP